MTKAEWVSTIVFSAVSLTIAILGFIFDEMAIAAAGVILIGLSVSISALHKAILSVRNEFRQAAVSISDLNEAIMSLRDTVGSAFRFIDNPRDIWSEAIRMVQRLRKGDTLFDISSGINTKDYEDLLMIKIKEGIRVSRLICFEQNRDNSKRMNNWLAEMLDPKADVNGRYEALRKGIVQDMVKILHLPYPLPIDSLLTEQGQALELISGFKVTDRTIAIGVQAYDCAFFVGYGGLVNNYKLHYLNVLWERARDHLTSEIKKRQDRCFCARYGNDGSKDSLLPA